MAYKFPKYVVGENERLVDIARRHGFAEDLIVQANPDKLKGASPQVQPGQTLTIPVTYRAQQGDTFASVARKFGVKVEAIIPSPETGTIVEAGRFQDMELRAGQNLLILPLLARRRLPILIGILALLLPIIAVIVWLSLPAQPWPSKYAILAPVPEADGTVKVLARSPVQIQSAHPGGDNVSRVELRIRRVDEAQDRLVRSDVPEQGVVTQEWVPQEAGVYTVTVTTINRDGKSPSTVPLRVEVVAQQASGITFAGVSQPTPILQPTVVIATPAPTRTPIPVVPVVGEAGAAFVVEAAVVPTDTPPPVRRYPPPPPAPGVPWGPTQEYLPPLIPPICDAAKYLGPFAPDRSRRISVVEPDDEAVKAVAGSTIHRAWRLQNVGTCTWGPGYELAFYGGRSMGSGGVAFESPYPADPPRRNVLVDNNILIVPEGKPNQTAILEILLNVPATPGIHQSYWRMRNPQGVYFGPIVGITLEVIRECGFSSGGDRVYGAPVINKFVILGVGDVYDPVNPVNVIAKRGEDITLEWNIINATNFDILFESPTGEVQSVSTTDTNSRVTFPTNSSSELGNYKITLFADNGVCTAQAVVNVELVPREGEGFTLDIASITCTTIAGAPRPANPEWALFQWNHFDPGVNQVILNAQAYRISTTEVCPLENIFGKTFCYNTVATSPVGSPTSVEIGTREDGTATVANASPESLCTRAGLSGLDPNREQGIVRYVAQAKVDGTQADPPTSNLIDCRCSTTTAPRLPTEIQGAGTEFNPVN